MAKPTGHDWYLRDWFASLGLKQRDLVTKLDYLPNSAHRIWHSLQQYRRDDIETIAALLQIEPFELLMPPDEAMALRRLRSAIAEVTQTDPVPAETAGPTATPARRRA
jgi:hypothetical protein